MPEPLRLQIEDTGLGVHIEGDAGPPGHRVWRIINENAAPAYILTRSVFHSDNLPEVIPIARYVPLTESDVAGLTTEQIIDLVRARTALAGK